MDPKPTSLFGRSLLIIVLPVAIMQIAVTYVFFDATRSFVNDFGTKGSWDLSDDRTTLAAALLFVF